MAKKTAFSAEPELGQKPMSFAKPAWIQTVTENRGTGRNHVSQEVIRLRAYEKWEAAGKPGGDGVRFWLEAERELVAMK